MLHRRVALFALALFAGICAAACGDARYLAIDLRTDFAAGVEYDAVDVSLDGLSPTRLLATTVRADRPRRLIERDDLPPGLHAVEVSLRLGETPIATRRVQFSLSGARIVTVIIARDCREVGCPTTGASECLGGRCVPPECTALGEPGCSEAECSTNADCPASVACAAGLCVEGACLEAPVVDACGASMVCVPERGCVVVAPSVDGGTARTDTGLAPFDAGGSSGPYAPVAPASNSVWTVQDSASPPIAIGASDPDGDIVSYEVLAGTGPLRGTVSFLGDDFVFTPAAAAVGPDSFTIRVSDRGGRFVDQAVSVSIVAVPTPSGWTYYAADGEAVTLGDGGSVTGTNALQEIVLANVPGAIGFDASFNRGDDVVRLTGSAGEWRAAARVGNATLTNGSTFALIPTGPSGLAIVFDDGARNLRFDSASGSALLASQTLTEVYLPITAAVDVFTLPSGIDPAARGRMFMSDGGRAVLGGRTDVFGTNGFETVVLRDGDIGFDASFNRGGDTIVFPGNAATFVASVSGSQVLLVSAGLSARIPVGMAGMSLVFGDTTYTLLYDGSDVRIGAQNITTTPAPLP